MRKYGVPRNHDSESPDIAGIREYGSKSRDCGKKYMTSERKRQVRRTYKKRARNEDLAEIERQLEDDCETGDIVEKFEMELSEYNRKMDEAMDKMLSMPETTPTDMMVRWQARENLIYADALIGPELFGGKND